MTIVDESAEESGGPGLDFSKVLVVSRSQINRIVVARIVERAGLKPISEAPR